jgi:hypothetical protein
MEERFGLKAMGLTAQAQNLAARKEAFCNL